MGDWPAGYLQSVEELNSGPPKTNPSSGRVQDLNPWRPDYKSDALPLGHACLHDLMRSYFSGYKQKSDASKENFNDTCEICSPGTFGGHPNRSTCDRCRGGVICLEGETFVLLIMFYTTSVFLQ